MAKIKLFNIKNGVKEYKSTTIDLERKLQNIIEANMEVLFGVKFWQQSILFLMAE